MYIWCDNFFSFPKVKLSTKFKKIRLKTNLCLVLYILLCEARKVMNRQKTLFTTL